MLNDPAGAPVSDRVRAGLSVVETLALRPDAFGIDDVEAARAAGLDDDDIRDAALVCTLFSVITRLADTLDFAIPPSWDNMVKALSGKSGYALPKPVLLLPRV